MQLERVMVHQLNLEGERRRERAHRLELRFDVSLHSAFLARSHTKRKLSFYNSGIVTGHCIRVGEDVAWSLEVNVAAVDVCCFANGLANQMATSTGSEW